MITGYDPAVSGTEKTLFIQISSRQIGKATRLKEQLEIQLNQISFMKLKSKIEEYQKLQEKLANPTEKQHTAYRYVQIKSHAEALKHGKHTGWCTGDTDSDHYQSYYKKGRLWVLYKPKKRRPSYQLFISRDGVEFRKKGNVSLDPWEFARENPLIKNWMQRVLPKRSGFGSAFDGESSLHNQRHLMSFLDRLPNNFVDDLAAGMRGLIRATETIGSDAREVRLRSREGEVFFDERVNDDFNSYSAERLALAVERRRRDEQRNQEWPNVLIKAIREHVEHYSLVDGHYGINYIRNHPARPTLCIGGPKNNERVVIDLNEFDSISFDDTEGRPRSFISRCTYRREEVRFRDCPPLEFFKHSSIREHEFHRTVDYACNR